MFILSISGNITDFGQDPDALDKKVPGYGAEHMTPSLVRSGPAWSQRPSAITKAASETRVNRARGRGGRRLWRIHYRDRALPAHLTHLTQNFQTLMAHNLVRLLPNADIFP
jgi:hypothetical protein